MVTKITAIVGILAFFVAAIALFYRDSLRAQIRALTQARDYKGIELGPYINRIEFFTKLAWWAGVVLAISTVTCYLSAQW